MNEQTSAAQPEIALKQAMDLHRDGRADEAAAAYRSLLPGHAKAPDIHYLLGTLAFQQEDWKTSEAEFRAALSLRPGYVLALNNLGMALWRQGRLKDAETAFRATYSLDNGFGEAIYNLGCLLQAGGDSIGAEVQFRLALPLMPRSAEVHNNLGACLVAAGRINDAKTCFINALTLRHDHAEAVNNLGHVHQLLGDDDKALQSFDYALMLRPDYVDAIVNKGTVLAKLDKVDEAAQCFRRALALSPGHLVATARLRQALGKVVPAWHFPMMNDAFRNQAYERAIRKAVGPEMRVLDIGTGAGLLAMMSARAGAKAVTSCEMVTVVADKAREIVERNGFADRVTVIGKKSNDVVIGKDMPAPADVLVSEILSSDLLGEGVLPAMEDARGRLVKAGGRIIPSAGAVCAFLAGGDDLELRTFAHEAAGFDISPFNEFSPLRFSIRRGNYPYSRYSDDLDIFDFDFAGAPYFPAETRQIAVTVTETGRCQGVVQWIRLQLEDEVFENHPDLPNPASGWAHMFHAFPESVSLTKGQTVWLVAEHDRTSVHIYLDRIES
jgi:Flp pilus assembly protein TadD